jgi:hypothetical protein
MSELIRAESPTGKVHFAYHGGWKDKGLVDPFCHSRTWAGDHWGKRWRKTEKPVTCKNCLTAAINEGLISERAALLSPVYHEAAVKIKHKGSIRAMSIEEAKELRDKLDAAINGTSSPKKKAPKRLTIGMRARIKKDKDNSHFSEYQGHEILLVERSSNGDFSVMVLGQKELKRKDPKTVINQCAWIHEDQLEFVDADLEKNLDFIDWYKQNEENFCGDCGIWRPWEGDDEEDWIDGPCPNEKCPGRLYDEGKCPWCAVPLNDDDICPQCDWTANM